MISKNLSTLLADSLQTMGLVLSEVQQAQLIAYVELLFQWNAVHNLTAIRDPQEMITRHILDCLTLLPFINSGKNICDVGTGAGLPGLILAIAKPDMQFVLMDSIQKKINFVQQAILTLRLSNAKALCTRVEKYRPDTPFDWIISRAFSSLSDFIQLTAHLTGDKGTWLAMKGKLLPEELAAIPTGYTMVQTHLVSVPHMDAERHLVLIQKS